MSAEIPVKPEEPAEIYDYPDHVLIVVNTHQTQSLPVVRLEKNVLEISYPREFVFKTETHVERHSIYVHRKIELPSEYSYELADMDFTNGVLTLKLKKL
jgi:hypothetical protein